MRTKSSWPAGLLAGLLAVAMLVATSHEAWAQPRAGLANVSRHVGEVVNISGDQITVRTESGQDKTFDVSKDARIFLDGQKTDLNNLKTGDEVLIATSKDAPEKAFTLRAFREGQEEPPLSPRETREARRTSRAALGVVVQETPDQKGVKVLRVRPDSPAAKAGIQSGDIILAVKDQNVDSPSKLSELLSDEKPGNTLRITFLQDGQQKSAEATLTSRSETLSRMDELRGQRREAGREPLSEEETQAEAVRPWLGLFIDESPDQEGVEVMRVFPGGPADKAGLESGDVVQSINGKKVSSPDDVISAIENLKPGEKATFEILRDDEKETIEVTASDRRQFLRDQRRFREGAPFREGTRRAPEADQFGEMPWPMMEQQRRAAQRAQRMEDLGQQVLKELRDLRKDVQQLQKEVGPEKPEPEKK
jgi:C-terminal processing protease CtpA/Prc